MRIGPGKSPSQWAHQEHEENDQMNGHGGEDELNNYDTGAGFFQVISLTISSSEKEKSKNQVHIEIQSYFVHNTLIPGIIYFRLI